MPLSWNEIKDRVLKFSREWADEPEPAISGVRATGFPWRNLKGGNVNRFSILAIVLVFSLLFGLTGCGGASGGPSEKVVRDALMGDLIFNIGDGNFHVDKVSKIQRGSVFKTNNGTVVYPLRITLSGPFTRGGKYITGDFDYYFYQDEFGSWKWEEKS